MEFIIKNEEDGRCLASVNLGCKAVKPLLWVFAGSRHVIRFENEEIAEATIAFIRDVLDWELAESLTIQKVADN